MISIEEYRKYNPYTEAIIKGKDDSLLVIDRYDINDYGIIYTDEEHLYDDTYGCSMRGTMEEMISDIKDFIIETE